MSSALDRLLADADRIPVTGWDLGRLGGRIRIDPPAWDFTRLVADHARRAADLLDLGTGGGEWLAALPHRPLRTVATEAWAPNLDVARARLEPLGVTVVLVEPAPDNVEQRADEARGSLPFPDASFDLVTSRHESFVAAQVARVLRPGGAFLTQQTGGDYGDFYDALGLERPPAPARNWDLRLAREQIERAGLRVTDLAEGTEATTFADAGALAWYLRTTPWVVEGFSTATHRPHLERLQARVDAEGPITLRQPSFGLQAVKPG